MGRQFRFFLLPTDENALIAELRSRFAARLLLNYAPAPDLIEIKAPFRMSSEGRWERAPRHRSGSYYLAPQFGQIDRNYYPRPEWWVIDSSSEGIEFSGCELSSAHLSIGRFYYEHDVLVNMEIVPKRAEFIRWAEKVSRAAKNLLQYDPTLMAYVGKGANEFRQQGGQFVTGIRPDGTMIPA
jgi:hypothetical protein